MISSTEQAQKSCDVGACSTFFMLVRLPALLLLVDFLPCLCEGHCGLLPRGSLVFFVDVYQYVGKIQSLECFLRWFRPMS